MRIRRALQDVRTIRALLNGAEAEARRGGDDLPGPEHLLLSAIALPDGTARQAFTQFGVDSDDLRAAINNAHDQALTDVGVAVPTDNGPDLPPLPPPSGPYRLTAPGQQVFQQAVALSKATRRPGLWGGHVVVAVCEQEHGTVARALRVLGVDRGALAAASREQIASA